MRRLNVIKSMTGCILALAFAAMLAEGCAKVYDPAPEAVFKGDAPILFGASRVKTKGAEVTSVDGLRFHVFSKDPASAGEPMLYDAYAKGSGNRLKLVGRHWNDTTYLYPRDREDLFRFYTVHADTLIATADEGLFEIPVGHTDVLWGESADSTPLTDPEDNVLYGFNFKYAVRAVKWYGNDEQYLPHISLGHKLSQLRFAFVASSDEAAAALDGKITLSGITLGNVCRKAVINAWDGSLDNAYAADTLIVRGTPVGPDVNGAVFGGRAFICPGSTSGMEFNYTLTLTEDGSNWTCHVSNALPDMDLLPGHYYILKIRINDIDDIKTFLEENLIDADADTFEGGLDFDLEEEMEDDETEEFDGTIDYE